MFERKETYHSHDFESSHSFSIRISVDEHTIIAWVLVPPEWACMDVFASHATNATWIAGSIECCSSRIEDLKLAFMSRAASGWDIFGVTRIIRVELREQKMSNETLQIWNSNFKCQCCYCMCPFLFCDTSELIAWTFISKLQFSPQCLRSPQYLQSTRAISHAPIFSTFKLCKFLLSPVCPSNPSAAPTSK